MPNNTLTSIDQRLGAVLKRLGQADDTNSLLRDVLDIAIDVAGVDMGTLQRYDDHDDCLRIVTSRGFSDRLLTHFEVVRRDTNSSCAAALKRRMRVVVNDVAKSYLFVGTAELGILQEAGVAAAHSTPLIGSSGCLWGVVTTHFREPQPEHKYKPTPLDRLAVILADHLDAPDA